MRGRLTLWYALSIPTIIFAIVFTAQQVMVARMKDNLDNTLRERSSILSSTILSNLSSPHTTYEDIVTQLADREFPSIPLLVRIANPRGEVSATFGDAPAPLLASLDYELSLPEGEGDDFDTIRSREVDAIRVYTVLLRHPATGEPLALIQMGDSLAPIAAAQDTLWLWTFIIGLGGSTVALLVGVVILHRGFRPLHRILGRVHEVESHNLQVGLPQERRPPELQELADSLNNMWGRLDKAFKGQQRFVANVSHELKTPLTALQGQMDVLAMDHTLSPESQESLERMSREVRRLIRMTNNLLLNAQLEANISIPPADVNLKELVEDVYSSVWVLAEDVDLLVGDWEDVIVRGDYDLLKQMLLNVVDNAIKFTPQGGQVEIRPSQEEGWAIISVIDTGKGISEESLKNVTNPFYRTSTGRKHPTSGAGLGLAIVKQIVELHKGQLDIQSQPGKGTTVTILLPLLRSLKEEPLLGPVLHSQESIPS